MGTQSAEWRTGSSLVNAMPRLWVRMFDADIRGAVVVDSTSEAAAWNAKGWGIYWTVNAFVNKIRRIDHLERILAWAVDIDEGTKAAMAQRICQAPLRPSQVVETKRGYQVYYGAKDGQAKHWGALVERRLIRYFGADKNAKDIARVMRVPGFNHWKDPANPYMVTLADSYPVQYRERDIAEAFPPGDMPAVRTPSAPLAVPPPAHGGDSPLDRLLRMDQGELMLALSGTAAVNGDRIELHERSGVRKVYVNGKQTSCWIDAAGKIGSLSKGGPGIWQWLQWYGHSKHEIVQYLKDAFGEVWNG